MGVWDTSFYLRGWLRIVAAGPRGCLSVSAVREHCEAYRAGIKESCFYDDEFEFIMQSKLGTSCDTACSLQDMDCDLPAIKALKDSAFAAIGVTCEKTVDRGGNSYFKYAPSVCTSSALYSTSFGLCNIASSTTCDAADD
eukprot:gene23132-30335_t